MESLHKDITVCHLYFQSSNLEEKVLSYVRDIQLILLIRYSYNKNITCAKNYAYDNSQICITLTVPDIDI